ncbi:uncharacterized protein GGS25DRAFT_145126 [Hypoxylon fragiforme]|uniref:uncharacterized protein n=1 Tax=Hypoxylon fragiforme TaxID=63214 RepID=UPI0020C5D54F|nr:uncharacterized protein GGS25DRAFT_145126 [Hypoxylon fragiforme]KAI2612991.1 hypothetical protein GGS25DRAFT_145126 [Hypoxylon fragiforme]
MRSRVISTSKLIQPSLTINPYRSFLPESSRPERIANSIFETAQIPPTILFKSPEDAADTAVSVIRAPLIDQRSNARFLIVRGRRNYESGTSELAAQAFVLKMLNWVQIVTHPTADTPGTTLLLHFDNKRYIFGNISEGSQRAYTQRGVSIQKVEDIFVTGKVSWQTTGGLLGTILVLADTLAGKTESLQAVAEERKKKGKLLRAKDENNGLPTLRIHGGKNLTQMLATARRFVFRKGLPLNPREVRQDPRASKQDFKPDWQDANINVWYMPVESATEPSSSSRKRTHEEFVKSNKAEKERTPSPIFEDEEGRQLLDTVVTQMFNSDWQMDALVETTLLKAQMPAKLFVRDQGGQIQPYTGPMPGSGQKVPDIPVLVRQPWPGAMVTSLPRTRPSNQSLCYIVKTYDRRGKFNPKVAEQHNVAKFDYKLLASGRDVVGKDGVVVTSAMVLGETVPGNGFAIVDLPDASYIDGLVNRPEWRSEEIMKGIHVIFWTLGLGLKEDPRLLQFMEARPEIRHIVTSPDSCPNRISFDSVSAQALKLRCIDPDRFPLPNYNNQVSISKDPLTTTSPLYESGRVGKTIQFAPQYLHQDDKVVPFPDLEARARADLDDEVLEMGRQARARISDPEFLEKIEKVESDIPHRDAEVITLGTGSALPSKYRNVSSTMVRVPGYGNYLFDCGENTLGQLRRVFGDELPEVLRDLKCIWISHLHADHHLGTASVIKAWNEETKQSMPSAKLVFASHGHMVNWLQEYSEIEEFGFKRLKTTLFNDRDFSLPGRICKPRRFSKEESKLYGLKQIDACFVVHCFGALATVLTLPSGFKIAYSGDCRPNKDFVTIGKGTTLLIHESTFDDELQADAKAKKHSTMSEAIDVGRQMGARRIMLTHFSQRYQKVPALEEKLEIREDAENAEGADKAKLDEVILVAFDYMRVKLGDFRKAQAFLPALQKLFEEVEDEEIV